MDYKFWKMDIPYHKININLYNLPIMANLNTKLQKMMYICIFLILEFTKLVTWQIINNIGYTLTMDI